MPRQVSLRTCPGNRAHCVWIQWFAVVFASTLCVAPLQAQEDRAATTEEENEDRRVRRTDPVLSELAFHEGVFQFGQGRYTEALRQLDQADPDNDAVRYYRGLALMTEGQPADAIPLFEGLVAKPGIAPAVAIDLGAAQLQAGDTARAITTLTRYVEDYPDDAYGNFFLGVALFRQGREEEARRRFEVATKESSLRPQIEFYTGSSRSRAAPGAPADGSMADIPDQRDLSSGEMARSTRAIDPRADRRWNLTVLTAYEYDSNIPLLPNIIGLGSGIQQGDSRALIASFGDYRLIQRENVNLGVIASTFDSFQFELADFNYQDYMGGAYTNAAFGRYLVGVNYQYHETLLGGRQFAGERRLVPSVTQRQGDFGHLTLYYEFDSADLNAPALIPAQIRSGNENSVGFTQAFYVWDTGRLYAGYRFANAETVGSDFDFSSNMVTGRFELPITKQVIWDAEVRYFWVDFDNPNSLDFLGRARYDNRVEVRSGVQYYMTRHISFRLDYTYIGNNSNVANLFGVEFYTYDRHVVSTQFIYDF